MKHLIVYAHPNPKSFNHAILNAVEKTLKAAGREYEVRDLNAMKFNPVLDRRDLELGSGGKAAKEIEGEQRRIREADVLIFIYPIWWFGMPAILKGYIERVFSQGFAFAIEGDRLRGLLAGKKVFIINTTGSPREILRKTGYEEAMRKTIAAGIFEFCGMEVTAHRYFCAVADVDDAARSLMLEEVTKLPL
jgi:NAD(P)H dehydrogenase (quinone)